MFISLSLSSEMIPENCKVNLPSEPAREADQNEATQESKQEMQRSIDKLKWF